MGATFMSGIVTATSHTKHFDVRHKYVEDDILKIVLVKFAENDSDIFTKNLGGELHEKHSKKLIGEKTNWFSRIGNIWR